MRRRPSFSHALSENRGSLSHSISGSLDGRPSTLDKSPSQKKRSMDEVQDSLQAVEDEKKKNAAKIERLINDPNEQSQIHYGDEFQLQHVATGK